jgi:hypothetical protein
MALGQGEESEKTTRYLPRVTRWTLLPFAIWTHRLLGGKMTNGQEARGAGPVGAPTTDRQGSWTGGYWTKMLAEACEIVRREALRAFTVIVWFPEATCTLVLIAFDDVE